MRTPGRIELVCALARLLAAAPEDGIRDGNRAMDLMQSVGAAQPVTVLVADTMAMVTAERGNYGDAIAWQRKAIAGAQRAGLEDAARHMGENLTLYQRNQPCRRPWVENEDLRSLGQIPIP